MGLLDRRLLFVTGKGGVGKTTVAAGLALLGARQGRRVLACEVDAKGDLADAFEVGSLAFQAREVQPSLWAMAMDTEASLREYLRLQLRVPILARLGPLAKMFDFVASAAPGVREILTVGKICWEVRERHYDLVVVDASATGHIVSQLAAPEAIAELVQVGLVREQVGWMHELLADPEVASSVVVTTAEEMPVTETLELVEQLRQRTAVDVGAVVVNRVLPELFGRAEEEAFAALEREPGVVGELLGPRVVPLLEAARLAVTLRRQRTEHLTRLRAGLDELGPARFGLVYVPELFTRAHGIRSSRMVADALAGELDS